MKPLQPRNKENLLKMEIEIRDLSSKKSVNKVHSQSQTKVDLKDHHYFYYATTSFCLLIKSPENGD